MCGMSWHKPHTWFLADRINAPMLGVHLDGSLKLESINSRKDVTGLWIKFTTCIKEVMMQYRKRVSGFHIYFRQESLVLASILCAQIIHIPSELV